MNISKQYAQIKLNYKIIHIQNLRCLKKQVMKKETFINKIISLVIGKELFSINGKNNNPIRKRVAKTIRLDREYSYNEIS
tara:strand:- start:150 stop:389 length:240 start_codon:yes stop_codon:yes gene_type:complete